MDFVEGVVWRDRNKYLNQYTFHFKVADWKRCREILRK